MVIYPVCTGTHSKPSRNWRQKSTPFFRHRFLVRLSCKSGSGFIWNQKPAPNRTLFNSKPETGVHMTEIMWNDDLTPFIVYFCHFLCRSLFIYNYSSFMSISAMSISSTRNFHSRRVWYKKTGIVNQRQKMESIYGADFWSVCHDYNDRVID